MISIRRSGGVLALSASTLLGACGGGGGGGAGPAPIDYDTAEYRAQYGNATVNAISAYQAGYSGDGVTVAVLDSGIDGDHPDFAGAIHPASADMLGRGTVDDVTGHGTLVAGVIGARRNGQGMHGVAFDSSILAVRTEDSAGNYQDTDLAIGTSYAVANGAEILNYSLGGPSGIGPDFRAALEQAAADDAVIVIAAGNAGNSNPDPLASWAADPDAQDRAIAVGAVDPDNRIAGFSNRAGTLADRFLVAPGVGIYTTVNGGGFAAVDGTLFAAPHVSAAAAILKERFPNLSANQIVDILLTSATDLGDPGVDPTYGHGLLDLDASLQPLGATSVPAGTTVAEGGDPLDGTSLHVGAAFGDALSNRHGFRSVLFVDGYDRAYLADLSGIVRAEAARVDLADWLGVGHDVSSFAADLGGTSFRLAFEEDERDRPLPPGPAEDRRLEDVRFALSQRLGAATRATVGRGYDLDDRFGLAATPAAAETDLLARNAFGAAYLGLIADGTSAVLHGRIAAGVGYRIGAVSTTGQSESNTEDETADRIGYAAELYHADGRRRFGLVMGGVEETGSVLGTTGRAAFGFDESVVTRFAGVFGSIPAGPADLFASYTAGWTDASAVSGNLIGGMSDLRSDTFSMGAAVSDVLREGDRMTLAVTRPLKVTDGTAAVDLPVGRTLDGTILRTSETVGLSPSGNELDAEFSYAVDLGRDQSIRFNAMTQFEPGHVDGAEPEFTAGMRYRLRF